MSLNLTSLKIPIDIYYLSRDDPGAQPHYFIKWAQDEKRYRISASFEFLNKRFGLRINIIRAVPQWDLSIDLINTLESSPKYMVEEEDPSGSKNSNIIYYQKLIDSVNKTELFMVTRRYDDKTSQTLVFFSLNYWTFEDYVKGVQDA